MCCFRLSLDTAGMDSDGEREDDDEDERPSAVVQPTARQQRPGDGADGAGSKGPCPRATHTAVKHRHHVFFITQLCYRLYYQ